MIPLIIQSGVAYVWNKDDWFALRSQHRICGALIGSAPSYPRQNDFLGLPMALMTEEAALLVEKGICELFEIQNITDKPSKADKSHFLEVSQNVLAEQNMAYKKKKCEQLMQKIDIIVAGKRQKLLSKGLPDENLDKETLLQEEINKLQDILPANSLVHLPTEHVMDSEMKNVPIDILRPSLSEDEYAVRYSIFKDLWERGHFITSGLKFGSDYLVYPGDPVKFHATYMVRCIANPSKYFKPASIVAFGRLSVAVNKLAVFAFRRRYGSIEYQTLQWHDGINS